MNTRNKDRKSMLSELWNMKFTSHDSAIQAKNEVFKKIMEECSEEIRETLSKSGENKFRKIRIFNNLCVHGPGSVLNPEDEKMKKDWQIDFVIQPSQLLSAYFMYLMPIGDPSMYTSWMAMASIYDENLEPISPLSSNGLLTIFQDLS